MYFQLEDEKLALQAQCTDHQNDIQSLRKELLQAEQIRLDLSADKSSFAEKIKFLEMEKEKVRNIINFCVFLWVILFFPD